MIISTIRIDDRLIHGQIVTKWIKHADASSILVIDDNSAANPMMKTILSLAVPSGITLHVLSKADAISFIKNDTSRTKTLIIMKNPKEMLSFIELGMDLSNYEVILGNMSYDDKKKDPRRVLDYIFVSEEDVEDLKKLDNKVKCITVKAVPEEKGKTIKELF